LPLAAQRGDDALEHGLPQQRRVREGDRRRVLGDGAAARGLARPPAIKQVKIHTSAASRCIQMGADAGGGCRTAPEHWVLHPAQHPRDPPVAGHDDAADDPPALVAVRVGVVAQEGLADPPAVAVGSAALGAAVALLIPRGVELQPVLRLPGKASISSARGVRGQGTPGTWSGDPRSIERTSWEGSLGTPGA